MLVLNTYRIVLLGVFLPIFFNWSKDPFLTASAAALLVYCGPWLLRPPTTAILYELQVLFSDFGTFLSLLFRCLAKMLFERAILDEGEIKALELAAERI